MASRMFIRSMASAAKSIHPPVQLFGIDGTYASALYTAAAQTSSIEKAASSLASLKSVIEKDEKFGNILTYPSLPLSERKVVAEVVSKTVSLDSSVSNLLSVLAENNRLNLLPQVISQFEILTDAHNGVVEATITSAQPLENRYLNRIQTAISKSTFVGEGKKLRINNKVNPDILGGVVVEVGDRTVDLSVSGKISKLNKLLTEAI